MAEPEGREQRGRAFAAAIAGLRRNPRDLAHGSAAASVLRVPLDESVPALIDLLGAADPDLRSMAAQLLRMQGDATAVPPLLDALQDVEENVRLHAIEALGTLGATDAIEPLVAIASGSSWFLAVGALEALADIGGSVDPARLRAHLGNRWVREAALAALVATAPESQLEPMVGEAIALLDAGMSATAVARSLITVHQRLDARHGGGDACLRLWLERSVTPERLDRVIHAAENSNDEDRARLVRVLTWLSGSAVAAALVRLLPGAGRPELILEALVRDPQRAIVPLLESLKSGGAASPSVIAALGLLGESSATMALIDHLASFPDRAIVVAGALARLRDPRALDALADLLADDDAAVRHAAIGAINAIGAPEIERRLHGLLADSRAHVREAAVRIAGYFGFPSCAAAVVAACADPVPAVRLAALECVAAMDGPDVETRLTAALAADDQATRVSAVRGLSTWESAAATPLLRAALGDPNVWVRYAAARALAGRHDALTRARLLDLAATDPAPQVRIAAIESAGAPASQAETSLLSLLAETDPEPEVRHAARTLLDRDNGDDPGRRHS
jgi:HEAT repeat protein